MSLVPRCVVCDRPVANPYAPDTHCERCKQPCPTCDGIIGFCQHPLPAEPLSLTEVEHIAPGRIAA